MNYEILINKFEEIANSHGLVGSFKFGADVYDLNSDENTYPIVYLVPKPLTISSSINSFGFTIFYVDKSDNYRYTISSAIRALKDIFEKLDEEPLIDFTYPQLNPFKGEFSDNCDGVYGDLTVKITDHHNRDNFIFKTKPVVDYVQGQVRLADNDVELAQNKVKI